MPRCARPTPSRWVRDRPGPSRPPPGPGRPPGDRGRASPLPPVTGPAGRDSCPPRWRSSAGWGCWPRCQQPQRPRSGVGPTTTGGGSAFEPFPEPPGGGDGQGLGARRTIFGAALAFAPQVSLPPECRPPISCATPATRSRAEPPAPGRWRARWRWRPTAGIPGGRGTPGGPEPAALPGRYELVGRWWTAGPRPPGIRVAFGRDHEWCRAPVADGRAPAAVPGTAPAAGAGQEEPVGGYAAQA